MKYIYSTQKGQGSYDHSELIKAYYLGKYTLEALTIEGWMEISEYCTPAWNTCYEYRLRVPDTYCIHESSSTLREVKGDAGPAVAEMLLDGIAERDNRIKELEDILTGIIKYADNLAFWDDASDAFLDKARAALNKEQK